MDDRKLIEFMGVIEKLKCNTRHSWTSTGRRESVAEHSWRLAVLCLLVRDRFPDVDMDKVLKMCLIHDFGEAVCGDIPSFEKTQADEQRENAAVDALLDNLGGEYGSEFKELFSQMRAMSSIEAKLWRALDMMEAVISHNEADVSTWIPLEYTENLIYGEKEINEFPQLRQLRRLLREDSEKKI